MKVRVHHLLVCKVDGVTGVVVTQSPPLEEESSIFLLANPKRGQKPQAGWFHTRKEKYRQKNEDRLNYLAKEISLNAPHRTIKANTRPSERQRPKIFIMGNLVHESNGKLMRIHRVQTTG